MAPESLGAGDGAHGTERSSRHRTSEHGHLQGDAPADRARLEHEHDYGRPGWQPSLLCWKGRKSLDRSNSLRVQRSKGRSDAFRGTNRRASDSPGRVRPPSAPAGPAGCAERTGVARAWYPYPFARVGRRWRPPLIAIWPFSAVSAQSFVLHVRLTTAGPCLWYCTTCTRLRRAAADAVQRRLSTHAPAHV